MKSLIIVSAAVGILSGTSISARAQATVNLQKISSTTPEKKQIRFIEGIETSVAPAVEVSAAAQKAKPDVVRIPASSVKLPASKSISKPFSSSIEQCTPLQFKFAQLMNVDVESVTNLALFQFIEEWWATRYRYGGTSRRGIDCSALTGTLIKEVYGVQMPRTAREQYRVTNRVSRNELLEGDLVFFNTRGGVSHVGVYVGDDCFVHASVHSGVTISSLRDNYYASKYIGGGRYTAQPVQKQEETVKEKPTNLDDKGLGSK